MNSAMSSAKVSFVAETPQVVSKWYRPFTVDIRELKLLAEFSHPNIVRLVRHSICSKCFVSNRSYSWA
jgi:hypothetical protein